MSDVDLYDDLPDLSFGEPISKIDEERQYFKKQLDEKEVDLLKTKEKIAHLEKDNKILEENISSLYKTAVSEIKRKERLIQELRREKESLIFRRKNRQNNNITSTTDLIFSDLGCNFHQVSDLPAEHLPTPMKSAKSVLSSTVNTVVKTSLETKCHGVYSSDISLEYKSSIECLPNSLLSYSAQEENRVSTSRASDVSVNNTQTSTNSGETNSSEKTCENNSSETNETLPHKLSSGSSQASYFPHQSGSNENSRETVLSKYDKRSLSSEERREKLKQKGNYSDKFCYSKSWHKSPQNSHRSLKLTNERNRRESSWDCKDDRKYFKDLHKETDSQEQKSRMGTCVESRRKHSLHSRRSPSPQRSWRYSDRRSSSSKFKILSDNVRVAAQLKSKYSKAIREKSVSCTPIKQQRLFQEEVKFEFSSKPLESQSTSCNVFPKLKLEDKFVSGEHNYESKLSGRKQSTETLTKCCSSDIFGNSCSLTLGPDKSSVYTVDQCEPVQRKENDSAVSDYFCQTYIKKGGVSLEHNVKMDDTEQNSSALSDRCNSKVYRSKSFLTQSAVLTSNKKSTSEKLPLQQLRTPPSKNLIPLKISPSFDDPAVVRENKFSFCVFNEQCEFKRPKRKRSVKLLVSEIKDVSVPESRKKYHNEPSDDNCEHGVAMKQNMNSTQLGNNDVLEQCVSSKETGTINLKNQAILNHVKSVPNVCNKSTIEENQPETSVSSTDSIHCPGIETLNTQKLSEVEMLKIKSPNKKRKLDSICEELKANLEKRNVTSHLEFVCDGNTNILSNIDEPKKFCSTAVTKGEQSAGAAVNIDNISKFNMTGSDTVNVIEPPKHIIISKRRRKGCNLQDNVVQVISQVKSRLS